MNLKFLKNKKKFIKGGSLIKPDLYWRYILGVTFIVILLACIFGLYLFLKIEKEPVLSVVSVNDHEMIKKERINKVLEYFKERENKSIKILDSVAPVVDPSL